MLRVSELRLIRPIEVVWETAYPVPRITLRDPDRVQYDPATRLVHVDTGRSLVLMPMDAESVDRMVLEPDQRIIQEPVPVVVDPELPSGKGYLHPPTVQVRKKTR